MSTSIVVNRVRRGFYLDSVALMRHSRRLSEQSGVAEASMMVGTPSNLKILEEAGLLDDSGRAATPEDLVVAVIADDEKAAENALAHAEDLLANRAGGGSAAASYRPRSLDGALDALPGANVAVVSVPGEYAAETARKAMRRGLHVLIFSDNVPVADEVALKREARQRGLLMMGPDCGTAILNGVPLAFANAVPAGDVGIVAASGTGLQEVSCLLAQGGRGISQAIGTGGRDLKAEVGGITTLAAINLLDADPATQRIVLISKPPSAEVLARVVGRIAESLKPFTVCFPGARELPMPANARLVGLLADAAADVLGRPIRASGKLEAAVADAARGLRAARTRIRGLFAGGTLCAEAQAVLLGRGLAVASNVPVPGASPLGGSESHALIDLGDDEFTKGRPHPMIDPGVRAAPLERVLSDPETAAVLIDLVLGWGAHADPAGAIRAVLERHTERPLILASVVGTDDDPQSLEGQIEILENCGVFVAPTTAEAARLAALAIEVR